MSVNLWWAFNDGMSGHVWLGEREIEALRQEMVLQGMAEAFPVEKLAPQTGEERAQVTPQEIEGALEVASEQPTAMADEKLWRDWLEFLGARGTRAACSSAERPRASRVEIFPRGTPGLPVPPRRALARKLARVVRRSVPKA